jgi:hypothetical protein
MPKATLEDKANAYVRLYNFLRFKHPEVLEEFRQLMKESKDRAMGVYEASMRT